MLTRSKTLLMFSLVLIPSLALGCKSTPTSPAARVHTSTKSALPTSKVVYGAVNLEPSVNMAFQVRLADLAPKYKLKALGDEDSPIQSVKITLTGPNPPPIEQVANFADFLDGAATFMFSNLEEGLHTYSIKSYSGPDGTGTEISHATSSVYVTPGQQITIPVDCQPSTGGVTFVFRCDDPCSPSPSPTATPTPSPTPTPTPSPVEPFDPSPYMNRAYGFGVDEGGNIYISGLDEGITSPMTATPGEARILKIPPSLQTTDPVFNDESTPFLECEFMDGNLLTLSPDFNGHPILRQIALSDGQETSDDAVNQTSYRLTGSWKANTIDKTSGTNFGKQVFTVGGTQYFNKGNFEVLERTSSTQVATLFSNLGAGNIGTGYWNPRPASMAWDVAEGQPVWGSAVGLFTPGATPTASSQQLFTGLCYGFVLPNDDTSEVLYTTYGVSDRDIHYWSNGSGESLEPAATFLRGNVYRIEKGMDGYYYVMLHENGCNNSNDMANADSGDEHFQIIKMDWNATTKKLGNPVKMVDSFANSSPTF